MNYLTKYLELNKINTDLLIKRGYKYSIIWYKKNCSCGTPDIYCPRHDRTLDIKSRMVFKDYMEVLDRTGIQPGLYGHVICKLMFNEDKTSGNDVVWRVL